MRKRYSHFALEHHVPETHRACSRYPFLRTPITRRKTELKSSRDDLGIHRTDDTYVLSVVHTLFQKSLNVLCEFVKDLTKQCSHERSRKIQTFVHDVITIVLQSTSQEA